MRTKQKASLFDLVIHETRAALRQLSSPEADFFEVYGGIASALDRETFQVTKLTSYLLIATIATYSLSENGFLILKTSFLEVNIPKIYAVFSCVSIFAALFFKLFTLLQLMVQRVLAEQILGSGIRFPSVLLAHLGHKGFDVLSPQRNGHLIEHAPRAKAILSIPLILFFSAAFFPLAGVNLYLLRESWSALFTIDSTFLSGPLSVAAMAMLTLPYVYIILYFTKFEVVKNKRQIRWGFLNQIFPKPHPSVKHWLKHK